MNEPTIVAAQRELAEEVKFPDDSSGQIQLAWYSGAFCTSDYITEEKEGKQGYHYVIAQCFAELTMGVDDEKDSYGAISTPPTVEAADDAQAAKWFTLDELRVAEANRETPANLVKVIERAEALYQVGMLPTALPVTPPV